MNHLYPIIRRVRRPLITADDRVKPEPAATPPPASPLEVKGETENAPAKKANDTHVASKQTKR
jgi:hypothetical protein